jgi:hypothetical protein
MSMILAGTALILGVVRMPRKGKLDTACLGLSILLLAWIPTLGKRLNTTMV